VTAVAAAIGMEDCASFQSWIEQLDFNTVFDIYGESLEKLKADAGRKDFYNVEDCKSPSNFEILEAQCRNMIQQWIKNGVLFRDTYTNPLRREEEKGLFVDANKRPRY
jgi:hypothetical protein